MNIKAFEKDFEKACAMHSVIACYVIVAETGERGSRLLIGGQSDICAWVEQAVRSSPLVTDQETRQ